MAEPFEITDEMVDAYALGRWERTGAEAALSVLTPQSRAAIRAALAAAAPLIAAQALNDAYWKLREHASAYRGAKVFRKLMEEYRENRSDALACRRALTQEFFARGIEAAARDLAELLGVEECAIEPRADELERGTDQ